MNMSDSHIVRLAHILVFFFCVTTGIGIYQYVKMGEGRDFFV